mmetsp:Transcript_2022/g.1470  ORF Transcript_2022/g.1470 Transcript_2022/m.1470 type:complete len:435 (-) Transcript_2022:98-1402(-)
MIAPNLVLVIVLVLLVAQTIANDGFDGDEVSGVSPSDILGDESGMGYDDSYGYPGGDGELDEHSQPETAKELVSLDEIETFINEADVDTTVIGFFDSFTNSNDLEAFKEVAMTDGHVFRFAFTTNKNVLEAKKYDGSAVVVYPPRKFVNEKFERTKFRYPSKDIAGKQQAILDFARAKSVPLTGEYLNKNKAIYDGLKKPVVLVFSAIDHERNAKGYNYLVNRVRKVAKSHEGKIVFALADTDANSDIMESHYGFENPSSKEVLVGLRDDNLFYKMESKFSVENLMSFIESFKAGELEGREKTSHEADHSDGESWDMRPVVSVNNNNVEEVLEETTADVMIEFYAPWCGHCQSLKPEYQRVGSHFEGDGGVTIAAFDATAGSVPKQFDVQGYPTLYFVPANSKHQPVPYEGERSAEAIIEFINSHRTTAKNDEL